VVGLKKVDHHASLSPSFSALHQATLGDEAPDSHPHARSVVLLRDLLLSSHLLSFSAWTARHTALGTTLPSTPAAAIGAPGYWGMPRAAPHAHKWSRIRLWPPCTSRGPLPLRRLVKFRTTFHMVHACKYVLCGGAFPGFGCGRCSPFTGDSLLLPALACNLGLGSGSCMAAGGLGGSSMWWWF
jgi:hypothetical protein